MPHLRGAARWRSNRGSELKAVADAGGMEAEMTGLRVESMPPAATLYVDLDGTLTPADTLVESVLELARHSPMALLRLPWWLMQGRAAFKEALARHAQIAVDRLPYNEALLEYLRGERLRGRRIVLATAAHVTIARAVASHLGLFDEVLATSSGRNLKGSAKLAACQASSRGPFVYAGDSRADLAVWQFAQAAILVSADPATADAVRRQVPIEREFARPGASLIDWMRALRIHQWLKNLLLFVPLLTSFAFTDHRKLATIVLGFVAFSLAASATYVANDLWDLENDRGHPRKKLRAFASGRIPILQGLGVAAVLLLIGLALSMAVSASFLLMVGLYLALTLMYSWKLKQYVLVDVLTLSLLYTFRILAGSVAIGVATSDWLLAFSAFAFLSLALAKRSAELTALERVGMSHAQGRDYRVGDLAVLRPLGIGAALSAVVVFGLFINAPETQIRYAAPQMLWFAAIGVTYWLGRLWIMTSRGEVHDDPVVYAITDRGSQLAILAIVASVVAAYFRRWDTLP